MTGRPAQDRLAYESLRQGFPALHDEVGELETFEDECHLSIKGGATQSSQGRKVAR